MSSPRVITALSFIRNVAGAALVAAVLTPGNASAQGTTNAAPAYVGTWASTPAQCRLKQDSENAPLVMRRDRYDQHEAHCKFKSVRAQFPAWAVKAQCEVEGDLQDIDMVLQVTGTRLTIRDETGARTLQRCP
jgi:hypothetical protein